MTTHPSIAYARHENTPRVHERRIHASSALGSNRIQSHFMTRLHTPLYIPNTAVRPNVSIVRVSIPNTAPNVRSVGTITINVAAVPTVVTFQTGSWTIDDINESIDTAYAGTPPIVLTYSSTRNRAQCLFSDDAVSVEIDSPDIASILGFPAATSISENNGSIFEGPMVPRPYVTNNYNVSCSLVDNGIQVGSTSARILASVPVTGPRNSITTYMPSVPIPFDSGSFRSGIISDISFDVFGDDLTSIDLNGCDWDVEIRVQWIMLEGGS